MQDMLRTTCREIKRDGIYSSKVNKGHFPQHYMEQVRTSYIGIDTLNVSWFISFSDCRVNNGHVPTLYAELI